MTRIRCTLISCVRMAKCGSLQLSSRWCSPFTIFILRGQQRDILVEPSFTNVHVALPLRARLTTYYWSWYEWWSSPHCCFWVSTYWSFGEYWLVSLFISIRRQLTLHTGHHWIILHYPALCAGYSFTCGSCKVMPIQRELVFATKWSK